MMSKATVAFIIGVWFSLSSCCVSEKTAARRINKYVECNPSLVGKDTVFVPQITTELKIDTMFYISESDTVFFIDTITNTKVQIIRLHDTLRVNIHTPPDTIQVPIEVPKIVVRECDKKTPFKDIINDIFLYLIIAVAIAFFVRYFILK